MADVFKALADPTRRAVLDALFECDGRTLADLCELFPDMTRVGVSKQLGGEPGRHGSRRTYQTPLPQPDPDRADPGRWVSRYAAPFTSALVDLDRVVAERTRSRQET